MRCPCGGETFVKDSRKSAEGTWRRRVCQVCAAPMTTMEVVCQTVKGTRVRPPADIIADRPTVIRKPKQRRAKKVRLPDEPAPLTQFEKNALARKRMEEIRMEKEYDD